MARLLFNLSKGFLYGSVVGIMFGIAIFLLASAVVGLGFLTIPPVLLAALIYAAGTMSGIAYEYSNWLGQSENKGLLFRISKGFLYGTTVGLYFSVAIFLLATAVAGLGFLIGTTPVLLAGLIFAVNVLAGVAYEYEGWLDQAEKATAKPK